MIKFNEITVHPNFVCGWVGRNELEEDNGLVKHKEKIKAYFGLHGYKTDEHSLGIGYVSLAYWQPHDFESKEEAVAFYRLLEEILNGSEAEEKSEVRP